MDRLQASGPREAVWWRCSHRQWKTLPDALDNPTDRRAWEVREKVRRARHDEELAQRDRERTVEKERWATEPPADPEPVAEVAPCERCGLPITGRDDEEPALPEDGRRCPTCRGDGYQHPTLRQALFGRQPRSK
ncbi:hypothetical protein [Streptomyces sp. NPDC005385]|uniref:hypothetical protein n=1 Tax=Streptomyces sp. NPDC005385 TaxID=3157039 RepID=UPI0033B9D016